MLNEILVIIIPLAGTVIGSIAGILTATRLTTYRIDQLEKKVDSFANLTERVALNENEDKAQWRRIDEIREDVEELKKVI